MRKIVNILLILLLLFSTTGVAISRHYCGEILQYIAVNQSPKSCCDDQDMPDGCCSDEVSVEKADDFQLSQLQLNLSFSPYLLRFSSISFVDIPLAQLDTRSFFAFHDPPPITEQDIFILDQAFLL